MTQRTTFALDSVTVRRLKRLSSRWKVSQAEVVRRAIADAENDGKSAAVDPMAMLAALHAGKRGVIREKAESYLAEIRKHRVSWRGE